MEEVQTSLGLIEWFIQTALDCGATSWSMEEVASQHAIKRVEAMRKLNLNRIAYDVFDFVELGVPQTRKRLIAGSPDLIARLQRARSTARKRKVLDLIAKPKGTHIKNTISWTSKTKKAKVAKGEAKYKYKPANLGDGCTAVTNPSPTLPTHGMSWVTKEDGRDAHSRIWMTTREAAAIQTFPSDYKWPSTQTLGLRQVGNAVPPLVAELMLAGTDSIIERARI
jgi:site-specific DNA-cytosine methylase